MAPRKVFALSERERLEFRAEFFNAFNHPVFAQPDSYIIDGPGATGVIISTILPQREIRLALKLHFERTSAGRFVIAYTGPTATDLNGAASDSVETSERTLLSWVWTVS